MDSSGTFTETILIMKNVIAHCSAHEELPEPGVQFVAIWFVFFHEKFSSSAVINGNILLIFTEQI